MFQEVYFNEIYSTYYGMGPNGRYDYIRGLTRFFLEKLAKEHVYVMVVCADYQMTDYKKWKAQADVNVIYESPLGVNYNYPQYGPRNFVVVWEFPQPKVSKTETDTRRAPAAAIKEEIPRETTLSTSQMADLTVSLAGTIKGPPEYIAFDYSLMNMFAAENL